MIEMQAHPKVRQIRSRGAYLPTKSYHKYRQFCVVMRNLCEKAPGPARFLATTILECSKLNSCQNGINDLQPDDDTTQTTKRKSASNRDPLYRPPKSSKIRAKKTNSPDKYNNRGA